MDHNLKELLVSRILSGTIRIKLNTNTYIYRTPSQEEFYSINEYYLKLKQEALSMELMSETEHFSWLLTNKMWSSKEEDAYKTLIKELDDLKVALFENFYKKGGKTPIKTRLGQVKEEMLKLYIKKHAKDNMLVDNYIRINKIKVGIALGIYTKSGKKVFKSVNHVLNTQNSHIVEESFNWIVNSKIGESEYRELGRTDPWKSYWGCREVGQIFKTPLIDITDEQKQLVLCSLMYDNIYKHTDCPGDEIIEDDDALDGWMIIQKRKRKNEENKNVLDGMLTNKKIRDSQEVFIMSDGSKESLDQIAAFNDPAALKAKKEKLGFLMKHGEVKEQDMPESQRKMRDILNGNANSG